MKYFCLSSADLRTNDFVFYKYWDKQGLYLDPRLQGLVCRECKKLEQQRAIDQGHIQGDIHTKSNWFSALDGPMCVTDVGKRDLEESGAKGLTYVAFHSTSGKRLWIVSSKVIVPTTIPEYMQFGPVCGSCGRYRSVAGSPKRQHLELPTDESVVCECSIPIETEWIRVTWLIASKTTVEFLRGRKLSGFRAFAVDR